MNKFFIHGKAVKESGGVFEFNTDDDLRVNQIYIMEASMKGYVEQYGDFIIVDSTHNTSKYNLLAMLHTLIDCLGKNVIAGKSLVSYERHEFLETASRFFSLSDPASVVMTDQSPGFTLAVENMQQTHLLCEKHFTTEMLSFTKGMNQEIRNNFMNDCHSAILDDFETEFKFNFEPHNFLVI
jgi:hypothetical protein